MFQLFIVVIVFIILSLSIEMFQLFIVVIVFIILSVWCPFSYNIHVCLNLVIIREKVPVNLFV